MAGKEFENPTALNTIWDAFTNLNVMCADRKDMLYYWKVRDDDDRKTTMELLNPQFRSGNCNAWATFFCDAVTLAGLKTGSLVPITVVKSASADQPDFYIKTQDWITSGGSYPSHPEYNYKISQYPIHIYDVTLRSIRTTGHPSINSIPCQGLKQPYYQFFVAHVVVAYGQEGPDCLEDDFSPTSYYDPSYGNKENTLLGLENDELDGTWQVFSGDYFMRKKSEHATEAFLKEQ
jgi:hypothetical protein